MNAMYRTATSTANFFEPQDIQRQSLVFGGVFNFCQLDFRFHLGFGFEPTNRPQSS